MSKEFGIKERLLLRDTPRETRPTKVLTSNNGIVGYATLDKTPKLGSGSLMSSDAIFKAIRDGVQANSLISGGGGGSGVLQDLQNVTTIGNFTNRGIELRNASGVSISTLSVDDTTGHTKFAIDADKRVETNGDLVAYGDGTSPGGSWWDGLPIATASVLGGVKIGTGVTVAGDGTISVVTPTTTFLALTDTPATFTASKLVAVNALGTALEYVDVPNSAVWGNISGTLSAQTDLQSALDLKLENIIEDLSPQLGADLDANNKIINDVREINFQYSGAGDNGPKLLQEDDDWLGVRNDSGGATWDTKMTVGELYTSRLHVSSPNKGFASLSRAYFEAEATSGVYISLMQQDGLAFKRLKVATPTETDDAVTKGFLDTSLSAVNLQYVMNNGNTSTIQLELKDATDLYTTILKTDTASAGNFTITVPTSKRAECNGDIVAFGDGTSPGGSWWDDLPIATASVLGGVKIGAGVTVAGDGTISVVTPTTTFLALTDTPATFTASKLVAVNALGTALEYVDVPNSAVWGNITGTLSAQTDLQSALDAKEDSFAKNTAFNKNFGTAIGDVVEIGATLSISRATYIDGLGKIRTSAVTQTELEHLDGVTSAIQTQLDSKLKQGATYTASQVLVASATADQEVFTTGISTTKLGYLGGVTSDIQTQLDGKLTSTPTGAISTVVSANLTASRALISDVSGKIAVSPSVTSTQLGYLGGSTSNIQTQLDGKAPSTITLQQVTDNGATTTNKITITSSTDGLIAQSGATNWAFQGKTTGKSNFSGLYFSLDDSNIYLRNAAGTLTTLINSAGNSYFNGGFLGIGAAPSYILDVTRNSGGAIARFVSTEDAGLILEADSDNVTESHNPYINFKQDGGAILSNIGLTTTGFDGVGNAVTGGLDNSLMFHHVNGTAGYAMQFATANTARMTIRSDTGYIGLGISTPEMPLHLYQGGALPTYFRLENTLNQAFDVGVNTSGNAILWNRETAQPTLFGTENTEKMRLLANGKLSLGSSAGALGMISLYTGSAVDDGVGIFNGTGSSCRVYHDSSDNFQVGARGGNQNKGIVVNSTGWVGILTTPDTALDVAGGIKITGTNVNPPILEENVASTFGNLALGGTSRGGYYGLRVGATTHTTLMSSATRAGLYWNDVNEWGLYTDKNSITVLMYNGSERLRTESAGAKTVGTHEATGDVVAYAT